MPPSPCRQAGFATVMVNSNPETVSTDYDTSDRLYFEPLTLEDVLNVIEAEKPEGVIVQFGGQTPLKLAIPLLRWLESEEGRATGTRLWGTSPESIDRAEDREQFEAILRRLEIRQPRNGLARNDGEARAVAAAVGYPVVVRPSYVLGGRAMEVVFDEEELNRYMVEAVQVEPDHPVLIDQYLENAIEVDVDALCDREGTVVIGGLMEHIEPAGIHSGDSACALPSVSLGPEALATIRRWSTEPGPGPGGARPDQPAVCGAERWRRQRNGVHHRSQPTGLPHRAFRGQGHRRAPGQDRQPADGRPHPGGAGPAGRAAAAPPDRERGGAALQALPRRRHPAGPGDALHRRGDGDRRQLRPGLRQGRTGRR